MLSYIAGNTKPDIAYALIVLSRYCNNPGRRHVVFLNHPVKYCENSNDDRLKFYAHRGPYDAVTMKRLTQARFQCDADLTGNLDNLHATSGVYRNSQRREFHKQDSGELVHVNC